MDKIRIRIGIIGSGGMATKHAEKFSQITQCQLMAVASRNPTTGRSLANQYGIKFFSDRRSLLDFRDLDAVVICTHNNSHSQIVIAALEAEKHVYTEYPMTRSLKDANYFEGKIETSNQVLRISHKENVSALHQALKSQVNSMGDLLSSFFARFTPGRGTRPEVLFNLDTSGPPSLFFVYHIYPLVDIFGPATWVNCGAKYFGPTNTNRYDQFCNSVTVEFRTGGLGQWNWAGGIKTQRAEEFHRIILTGGTLIKENGFWHNLNSQGKAKLSENNNAQTLQAQFLEEIKTGTTDWRRDAKCAVEAAKIGLAAEVSTKENRRYYLA